MGKRGLFDRLLAGRESSEGNIFRRAYDGDVYEDAVLLPTDKERLSRRSVSSSMKREKCTVRHPPFREPWKIT